MITTFYTAFAAGDVAGMNACYHPEATFSDPAFGPLNAQEVKAMWEMLLSRGDNKPVITFSKVEASAKTGAAHWEATYTYGPQKRPVHNRVEASFVFRDGLIAEHHDRFDLWKWSRQALGLPGILLGWTPFMQAKIQQTTGKLLRTFMEKRATE